MSKQPTNEMGSDIDRSVNTWIRVLTGMGGRTAEEARRWVEPLLRDRPELTLHEPAAYWVAPALVPAELTAALDPNCLGQLHADLQFAIDQGDSFWEAAQDDALRDARRRALAVLDAYRTHVPPGAISDVLQTNLPKSEALELGVRAITRRWRRASVSGLICGGEFGRHAHIPFGKASRLLIHGPDGKAHLWWDIFGLNLVVITARREQSSAPVEAVRFAFDHNRYRGLPRTWKAAA